MSERFGRLPLAPPCTRVDGRNRRNRLAHVCTCVPCVVVRSRFELKLGADTSSVALSILSAVRENA